MKRLDPDTLDHVAAMLRRGAESTRDLATGLDQAFYDCIEAMAVAAETLASQERALPPRLSDWARACEGTALGEPMWVTDSCDPQAFAATWLERDISVRFSLWRPAEQFAQPMVGGKYVGITCATPAELRAALERLAEESK